MKLAIRIFLLICLGIQCIPRQLNREISKHENDAFHALYNTPPALKELLEVACYNCHSNHTEYPWYASVQPFAFFISQHIQDGKSTLNFNEFAMYSDRRKQSKLRSMVNQIEENQMPPYPYQLFHQDATFSGKDKMELISWLKALQNEE